MSMAITYTPFQAGQVLIIQIITQQLPAGHLALA